MKARQKRQQACPEKVLFTTQQKGYVKLAIQQQQQQLLLLLDMGGESALKQACGHNKSLQENNI